VFLLPAQEHGGRKEDERAAAVDNQALVVTVTGVIAMKTRVVRLMTALATVASLALAGGASVRGF
jgi:hypothetical protein